PLQTFLLERVGDHVLAANVQVFDGVPPSPYYDEETVRAEERERTGIARLSWYTCVRNTRSIVLWVAIITSCPAVAARCPPPGAPVLVPARETARPAPTSERSSLLRQRPQTPARPRGQWPPRP